MSNLYVRAGSRALRTAAATTGRPGTAAHRLIPSTCSAATPRGANGLCTVASQPIPAYGRSLRDGFCSRPSRKLFSTSQRQRATVVTQNMRQDEEGKDMLIEITERAQKRLRDIAAKDKNPELALRVTVQAGGCHGFQYLMSLTSMKEVDSADDTVFATEEGDARVVMDEPSLELLKGSQVDFTMELIGSQFKITGNPAASSSCGCGTSFDIKM